MTYCMIPFTRRSKIGKTMIIRKVVAYKGRKLTGRKHNGILGRNVLDLDWGGGYMS